MYKFHTSNRKKIKRPALIRYFQDWAPLSPAHAPATLAARIDFLLRAPLKEEFLKLLAGGL